ncbi:MAG: TRAP transporter small permease subunit [Synergistaceae bacterium]|jgi:TRAP-type C4-dicarboxylate transport system permease small subunit|nr:TRAP transporter small permease subunit [Synergistaceae bacterium]
MKKFNALLGNIESIIAGFFLLVTTTTAFFQVLNRHIFHFAIMGMGDLCVYAYTISLFFAFAYASYESIQTSVEIIPNRLAQFKNKNIHKYYCIFLDLLSIVIVAVFVFSLYGMLKKAIRYPEWGTLIRWFNMSWLVYALFFTFCLCVFHMLLILRGRIASRNGGNG